MKEIIEFFADMIGEYFKTIAYVIGCIIIITNSPNIDVWIGTGISLVTWAFAKAFQDHM